MRHEHDAGRIAQRAPPGNVDNQVARLGRQRNLLVGLVEADGTLSDTGLLERSGDLLPDGTFLTRDALDGEKTHQPLSGSVPIDGVHGCSPVRLASSRRPDGSSSRRAT